MLQEQILFPGQYTQGTNAAIVSPRHDTELVSLKTSLGNTVVVLLGKAVNRDLSPREDANIRPTIIFFYGNAMCLADTIYFSDEWRRIGANVLLVEYPGYGMSSGKPGEKPFYAAADAAYDFLMQRTDINKSKVIPVGLSIGTGVAVDLASRRPAAGMALFAPFTSMDDVAHHTLPFLPTSLILRHHFRSIDKIGNLAIPILIAHGRQDSTVPAEMSARLARQAAKAKITRLLFNAGHNDLFIEGGDELDAAMQQLINEVHDADKQ
jgi:pimeloyl-ACP methyl ester carboxylesterase